MILKTHCFVCDKTVADNHNRSYYLLQSKFHKFYSLFVRGRVITFFQLKYLWIGKKFKLEIWTKDADGYKHSKNVKKRKLKILELLSFTKSCQIAFCFRIRFRTPMRLDFKKQSALLRIYAVLAQQSLLLSFLFKASLSFKFLF